MNATELLAAAKGFLATVQANPAKYEGALSSALSAASSVSDVISKLRSGDPLQVAAVNDLVGQWDFLAATQAATAMVVAENEKDAGELTLDDMAEGFAGLVKFLIAVSKFMA